jgi:hypothetical protein
MAAPFQEHPRWPRWQDFRDIARMRTLFDTLLWLAVVVIVALQLW